MIAEMPPLLWVGGLVTAWIGGFWFGQWALLREQERRKRRRDGNAR